MTGFGRGEAVRAARKIKVELRTLNSRHLDIGLKIPKFLLLHEDSLRKRLAKGVFRGKVEAWVGFESASRDDFCVKVNEMYAYRLLEASKILSEIFGLEGDRSQASLDTLLRQPDIFHPDSLQLGSHDEISDILHEALDAAMADLDNMRSTEGLSLVRDIQGHSREAKKIIDEIGEHIPHMKKAAAERLRSRVADILEQSGIKLDDERLYQEIAILADKSDISEELSRLSSHFGQLSAVIMGDGSVGRKIDFIVQEMNRETNTIGSKVQSYTLSARVVDLKSTIEKIREQAQNIE